MLTPIEIQGKNFKTGFGYDKKDIDAFFRDVLRNYEIIYKENVELNDKISVLNERIQYYKTIEKTLQKALVLAEQTAEETRNAASKQAKAIEKEARGQAKHILSDAQSELDRIQKMTINLVQQYEKYRIQYKQLAATQWELLESPAFDISLANIDSFLTKDSDKITTEANIDRAIEGTDTAVIPNINGNMEPSLEQTVDSASSILNEDEKSVDNDSIDTDSVDSDIDREIALAVLSDTELSQESLKSESKELSFDSLKNLLKGLTDSEILDRLKALRSPEGMKSDELLERLKDYEELDELMDPDTDESGTLDEDTNSDCEKENSNTIEDEFEFIDFEVNLD